VGDTRHPLRLVVRGCTAWVTVPNRLDVPLGAITCTGWHQVGLTLEPSTGNTTVVLDGAAAHAISLPPLQAVWVYLGQGYRTTDIVSASRNGNTTGPCVEIELESMQSQTSHAR
jgi:hypothetical protein